MSCRQYDDPIVGCAVMVISAAFVLMLIMGVLHLLYGI